MKHLLLFFVVQICMLQLQAQHFALGNDKFNIAYLGIDNPISIAVENCPCTNIVLKVEKGSVRGENCKFVFRGKEIGPAYITVFKKVANRLKKIGKYSLRVKRIPTPVLKIGPYSSYYNYNTENKVQRKVLAAQQFVRADIENLDICGSFLIDSFSVKIFYSDSTKMKTFSNVTGKISKQISYGFSILKKGDVVIFHKVFAKGPDGFQCELEPMILTIDN